MAVKPVKNVPYKPTNPGWGAAATFAKPVGLKQTNAGWGAATNANDMSAFGYNAPGTAANPSAPFAPAVSAPPGGGGAGTPGHWNTTDWAAMIPGDWEVTQAEAMGNRAQGEAEAAFQKQLRQAFIDYGGDSSKLGDYAKYIDEPTIAAAQNNKFSQTAQNLAAMTKGLRQSRAALAARGIGASGANTEMTRRALEAKEQGDYGALRSLLGYADEGTAGLAATRMSIAEKINAARQSAAARLAEQYPNTWDPGTPAASAVPPAAAGGGGISWGGKTGITTKAGLMSVLAPGVSYAQWAANHPAAAAKLA